MADQFQRTVNVRAGHAPGEFEMILATEGEASDGHILSIAGGSIPDKMPLLEDHWNSATDTMGSVVKARKDLSANPAELIATGQIEMGGEGEKADIRRDLAHMIEQGHVNAVSIRWDDIKSTRRINLPGDHQFFVDPDEVGDEDPRRWGMFFEQWRALEGSVVALGADPAALMKKAQDCEAGERREFWRGMAGEAIQARIDASFKIEETEPTLSQVMDELARINGGLIALVESLELGIQPEADQQPEDTHADQRAEEEADQRPPEAVGVTRSQLQTAMRESRVVESVANERLAQRMIDKARGRVHGPGEDRKGENGDPG